MIDIDRLIVIAENAALDEVSAASRQTRGEPFRGHALFEEVEAAVRDAIARAVQFDGRRIAEYLDRFPEMLAKPVRKGRSLQEAVRDALIETVRKKAEPAVNRIVRAQYDGRTLSDLSEGVRAATQAFLTFGEPLSEDGRERLFNVADGMSGSDADMLEEDLAYVADRLKAQAAHQLKDFKSELLAHARRLEEAREFLETKRTSQMDEIAPQAEPTRLLM